MNKYKKELIDIVHKHLPNCKIILFGSRARETHQEGADIDLAIDTGKKVPLNTILDIKSDLDETTIPMFVDIVDIHSIPADLKEEIEKDGKLLWPV